MSGDEGNGKRNDWEGTCVHILMLAIGTTFLYYGIGMLSGAYEDLDIPGGRFGVFYVALVLIGGGAWFVWSALRDLAGSDGKRGKRRRRRKNRQRIDRIIQKLSGRVAK